MTVRKGLAIAALLTLGGLVLATPARRFAGDPDLRLVLIPLLLPLGITIVGLLGARAWSRWLGLAAGLAVLPWAVAFVTGPSYGLDRAREWTVLLAGVALVAALTGPAAYRHFEGRGETGEWAGKRMTLVRWTLILSVAAVLNLYMFALAVSPTETWHSLIPAGLALGLVLGASQLARRKTAGLLVLALSALLLPPALIYFVSRQYVTLEEVILFAAVFSPAWLASVATLVAFAGPVRRFVRD